MLFFLVVAIADGFIVGFSFKFLCELILGDKPIARLLRLIISIGAGIGYTIWVLSYLNGTEGTILGGLILCFAPIVLMIILLIIGYMFNGKGDK